MITKAEQAQSHGEVCGGESLRNSNSVNSMKNRLKTYRLNAVAIARPGNTGMPLRRWLFILWIMIIMTSGVLLTVARAEGVHPIGDDPGRGVELLTSKINVDTKTLFTDSSLSQLQVTADWGNKRRIMQSRDVASNGTVDLEQGGDDPLKPGCVCIYNLPGCAGPVSGRIVDECFPHDGTSLQENTTRGGCARGNQKHYNCEEVLGDGARCELRPVDCCGVATQSALCVLPEAVGMP